MPTNSPFADNANALLTFKVGTGIFNRDQTTGAQIEVTGTVEIQAMLTKDENPRAIEMAGNDLTQTLLSGRAIDPQYLPNSIQVGARGSCALVDLFTGAETLGEFTITALQQSPFAVVTEVLGSKIEGFFKVDNAGEVLYEA